MYIRFLFLFLVGLTLQMSAQEVVADTLVLPSVTVRVSRLGGEGLGVPASVSVIWAGKGRDVNKLLSVNELLGEIPGLFALNAHNYTQDLRVSIRGFGARAAFGIRGVRIMVDDFPETTPDGQGQTDHLDLGLIEKIEVLRGPSAALYGNASGGVIRLETLHQIDRNFVEAGLTYGAFDSQRIQLKSGWKKDRTTAVFNGTYFQTDGYRDHAFTRQTNLSTNLTRKLTPHAKLKVQLRFSDSPQADDPGGLTLSEVESNRRQARDRNLLFDSGESVRHFSSAFTFERSAIGRRPRLTARAFYSTRDLYARLPFQPGGIVDLARQHFGLGWDWEKSGLIAGHANRFLWGADLAVQRDNRRRYNNEEGTRGNLSFHQIESFANLGVYAVDEWHPFDWVALRANLRFDYQLLEARDRLLSNGDDSGLIEYGTLTGGWGASFFVHESLRPFFRFSTSFETPTLSELSANPDGQEGFNETLLPQTAFNVEAGLKGAPGHLLRYELTGFFIRTNDEIVPFELPAFPGRLFFRNAGKTRRLGVEAATE
ncbi:MAG: hypothetical protein D6714_12770, partial [Bacteroidetes bacterium]